MPNGTRIDIYRVMGRERTHVATVNAECEGEPTIDDIAHAFKRWATDQFFAGNVEGCVSRYEYDAPNHRAVMAWGPCPNGSCGNCFSHIAATTGIK